MVFDDKVKKVSSYTVTLLANIIKGINMSEERAVKNEELRTLYYSPNIIRII